TQDIDRVWSIFTPMGGKDNITTGDMNDIVLGGADADTLVTGDGRNIFLGDSGKITADDRDPKAGDPAMLYSVHDFIVCKIETIGFKDGGNGTICGSQYNDVLFGGAGNDLIYAGTGDDLVFGDQGMVECKNDHPFDPDTSLRPICWDDLVQPDGTVAVRGFL